jgi:CheY-like chemotaxis protein
MTTVQVLVVDDHHLYRETFCNLLQGCFPHLNILTAADGSTALSLTRRTAFALLVLDYQLPTINGGDVIRHLRARGQANGPMVPRIILTSTQPDVARFARMLKADAFLPKPTNADEITAVVNSVFERPHSEISAPGPKLWRIQPPVA